jgi:hypothetical protein
MSILGDAIGRSGGDGSSPISPTPTAPPTFATTAVASPSPASSAPSTPQDGGRSELRRRRDALAEQVTELHWDLGGLTYEMAIRDHFRLDVLVRRAAVLQERDAELAEIERLLRLEESASAGSCPNCAAPHSRGALFCWQCGATLMERSPAGTVALPAGTGTGAGEESSTVVMDALLAPGAHRGADAGGAYDAGRPFGAGAAEAGVSEAGDSSHVSEAPEAGGAFGTLADE